MAVVLCIGTPDFQTAIDNAIMDSQFHRNIIEPLKRMDKLILCFHVILLFTGVVFIYGAGKEVGGTLAHKWIQQLQWITVGIVVYFACAAMDYHKLGRISWIFYSISMLLLLYVAIFGITINNARSWISIAGLSIQPSEFAKPATLLFMSWAVTHPNWHKSPIPPWVLIGIIIFPPLLLVLLQPDFGTALVFIPFSIALAIVKGLRWKWLILAAVVLLIMFPLFFQFLKPHQKARVKVFLEAPTNAVLAAMSPILSDARMNKLQEAKENFFAEDDHATPDGKSSQKTTNQRDDWNARQSLLAVGSGGITGKGFLKGTQHVLGYLPRKVSPTDFIFSVIAEETGFFGSAMLLVCFASIILCGCRTALLSHDQFGVCLALGVSAILATHTFINIGMTVQAAPIIGIPLPFVSYGGSFMVSIMALAGLSQSVHIHQEDNGNVSDV